MEEVYFIILEKILPMYLSYLYYLYGLDLFLICWYLLLKKIVYSIDQYAF